MSAVLVATQTPALVEANMLRPAAVPESRAGAEEIAQARAEAFLRELLPGAEQGILPVVIGAGLEQAHPELGAFRRVRGLPVLFAGGMTPAGLSPFFRPPASKQCR